MILHQRNNSILSSIFKKIHSSEIYHIYLVTPFYFIINYFFKYYSLNLQHSFKALMNTLISQPFLSPYFTPQHKRNTKSLQRQKILQRISLIKYQLQKHKLETSLDQAHLKHITSLNESLQKRVRLQIVKCKELKQNELKKDENRINDNLRKTQNKNGTLKSNKNLYNSHCLNSKKTCLKSHNITNSTLPSIGLSEKAKERNNTCNPISRSQTGQRRLNVKVDKNIGQKEKNGHLYLKETFLTSIIFILLGTVFRQILSIV